MAKKKKRKSAGPPPVTGPKRPSAAAAAEEAAARPQVQKRKAGEPVPPSFRGVLLRAGIIAVLFYPYMVYAAGATPAAAFLLSVIALAFMIPLGLWLDRFRYRRQLRRWEERRAARTPGR